MASTKQSGLEFGLPGLEHFTAQDYIQLFYRRKTLIIFVAFLVGSLVSLVGYFIPNIYRATTVILVDPRKVPDNYVASTVSSGVADRLATLRQQVLSSTRLTQVMDEMKLYPELRNHKTQDELVELMRKNIEIEVVASASGDRGLGAFRISFESNNRTQSSQVTNRLASLFIEENIKAREQEVLGTAEFIDRELEDAKKDLQAKEDKIRQLKTQYVADLPESQTMHVQALNSLQLELRSEIDAINRAQQQKVYFQSQLLTAPQVVNLDRDSAASELLPLQTQLGQAQTQLETIQRRYGPDHPDVIKKSLEVKALENRIREAKEVTGERRPQKVPVKSQNPVIESQIAAADEEIKSHTQRQSEIKQQIAYHQSKLERIPVLEQQLASVTRDYENARDHYKLLMDRKFSADMSSSLETYQKGERFIVLDPAEVPEKPYRPNRPLIDAAGLATGFVLGIALALLLEMMDPTLRTVRELKALVPVPVLGEIPVLEGRGEQQRNRIRHWIGAISCVGCALLFAALVFITRN